jgi:ComF family protein
LPVYGKRTYLQHNKYNTLMLAYIIGLIAPHTCLVCTQEGAVLCADCGRGLPAASGKTTLSPGVRIFAATRYQGVARRLVHTLKFERRRAAAKDLARIMTERLPVGYKPDVITWVPTATSRVRARGYDQAKLLACALSRRLGVPCLPLLTRSGQQRQVGQTKAVRMLQLQRVFRARPLAAGQRVLLVDDVLTTGSTLRVAADVLQQAGATHVDTAVFARAD